MPFYNPYHFIPVTGNPRPDDLSLADFQAHRRRAVTHDRYVSILGTGAQAQPVYSGRLICRLTTRDPVVLGGQQDTTREPHEVHPFLLDDEPALPASSLRGLISSLAEAASNSALRVLANRPFARRMTMAEGLSAVGMILVEKDTQGKDAYRLIPLAMPNMKRERGQFTLPQEYRRMFSEPRLKVYVHGYQSEGTNPPKMRYASGSFLDLRRPKSYHLANEELWYLPMPGSTSYDPRTGRITATAAHMSGPILIGEMAVQGSPPLSQAQFDVVPVEQQGSYMCGILRVLGIDGREDQIPKGKTKEMFIPFPEDILAEPDFDAHQAVSDFHALSDERWKTDSDKRLPFELKGSRRNDDPGKYANRLRLKSGDLVFFRPDPANPTRVAEVAVSSIWRRRAGGTAYEFFSRYSRELLPFNAHRTTITTAEQIFGFAPQEERGKTDQAAAGTAIPSLAGRVRFSHARLQPGQAKPYFYRHQNGTEDAVLKILAGPKPPCPSFYFKPAAGGGAYISKAQLNQNHHRPQGRKYYLHREAHQQEPWRTIDENGYPEQKSRVTPLRVDLSFLFHIDFENLTRGELALLCYALRPTQAFRHKLGMGKSIGLGKVHLEPQGIFYIDRSVRYLQTDWFGEQAGRYFAAWLAPGMTEAERRNLQSAYPGEKAAPLAENDSKGFDSLCSEGRARVPEAARKAIEYLGDPERVTDSVHTPQLANRDLERETYRWFVSNDNPDNPAGRQFLRPFSDESDGLPPPLRD